MHRHLTLSKHMKLLALVFFAAFVMSFSINKALAAAVTLKTGMAQKFMTIGKGASRTAYLHINLEGIALPDSQDRAPVNVAIVIDKSRLHERAQITAGQASGHHGARTSGPP